MQVRVILSENVNLRPFAVVFDGEQRIRVYSAQSMVAADLFGFLVANQRLNQAVGLCGGAL